MASECVGQPFFKDPNDAGLEAFNSIDTWPSMLKNPDFQNTMSNSTPDQLLKTFTAMPPTVQKEFAQYPTIVQMGLRKYAESGDAEGSVRWIVRQLPSMLLRPDRSGYIPIEAALESGNGPAVRAMLDDAERAGVLERLLGYRNARYGHTLLMLAVHLNRRECSDIFERILKFDPTSLHRCYDSEGKNVLHRCTELGFGVSFQIIFGLLIKLKSTDHEVDAGQIRAALEMTDNRQNTPIHHIVCAGTTDMLRSLQEFLRHENLQIDFNTCFKNGNPVTPLMFGVQKGHYEVCEWLLKHGSINVDFKQQSTGLTALHFAVRAGNAELIRLLMQHGADPEFRDSDCEALEGYRTPLELAKSEDIPNKQLCIESLNQAVKN